MQNNRLGLFLLLTLLSTASCGGGKEEANNGEVVKGEVNQEVACAGTTYSTCICPGHKVCPVNDGEYDFVDVECEPPIEITAQNIDNIVGSLRLKDPPCADQQKCKRVSIFDRSAAPANQPECRCREKTSVCTPKAQLF